MRFAIAFLCFALIAAAAFNDAAEGRNLRRRRQIEGVEGEEELQPLTKPSLWEKVRGALGSIRRMGSQTVVDVKDSVNSMKDQVSEATKQFASDPKAFMKNMEQMLPNDFFQKVKETLKSKGLEVTPKNIEYAVTFSLIAAGVPPMFANKMAQPISIRLSSMLLGRDIIAEQMERDNQLSSAMNIDMSNGNLKLDITPGSKATLGEPLEDGRTPVHLQITGQLEYIPPPPAAVAPQTPIVAPQALAIEPAIENTHT